MGFVSSSQRAEAYKSIGSRRPAGLEQYELDGRPDGRPAPHLPPALAWHLDPRELGSPAPPGPSRELRPGDCPALSEEAHGYYERLVVLVRLGDWPRVDRQGVIKGSPIRANVNW